MRRVWIFAGLLAICGPAGSGKTTTAYAVLDAIVRRHPGLSVVSIEVVTTES